MYNETYIQEANKHKLKNLKLNYNIISKNLASLDIILKIKIYLIIMSFVQIILISEIF